MEHGHFILTNVNNSIHDDFVDQCCVHCFKSYQISVESDFSVLRTSVYVLSRLSVNSVKMKSGCYVMTGCLFTESYSFEVG